MGSMRADAQEGKGGTAADSPRTTPEPTSPEPATREPAATDRLRVVEAYASRQGEGRWSGAPSVFLRTSGCNLRCWFCDTPFA
ncbi:MAG: hypothetical protein ACTHK7_24675, partial [Aureliella sp.]